MVKTINDYLNIKAKKILGERYQNFLEYGIKQTNKTILSDENYVCFHKNDIENIYEQNKTPLKVVMGIKLPDYEFNKASKYYDKDDTATYQKIIERAKEDLFKNVDLVVDQKKNCLKIEHNIPIFSITIFPFFIKEIYKGFYISKGDGQWQLLDRKIETIKVPIHFNPNIMKVVGLIHNYTCKNKFKINDNYIAYVAFTNLIDRSDLDLKASLLLVFKCIKKALRKDPLVYNKLLNASQMLGRAIKLEKKNNIKGLELLEVFY